MFSAPGWSATGVPFRAYRNPDGETFAPDVCSAAHYPKRGPALWSSLTSGRGDARAPSVLLLEARAPREPPGGEPVFEPSPVRHDRERVVRRCVVVDLDGLSRERRAEHVEELLAMVEHDASNPPVCTKRSLFRRRSISSTSARMTSRVGYVESKTSGRSPTIALKDKFLPAAASLEWRASSSRRSRTGRRPRPSLASLAVATPATITIFVTSGGAPRRDGGPATPNPRFTHSVEPARS